MQELEKALRHAAAKSSWLSRPPTPVGGGSGDAAARRAGSEPDGLRAAVRAVAADSASSARALTGRATPPATSAEKLAALYDPFQDLEQHEINIAETLVAEHVLHRRSARIEGYIRMRASYLETNVSRQKAMLRTAEVAAARAASLAARRHVFKRELTKTTRRLHELDDSTAGDTDDWRSRRATTRAVARPVTAAGTTSVHGEGREPAACVRNARSMSNAYTQRIAQGEGGGFDAPREVARETRRKRQAVCLLQRMYRGHLFRLYVWAVRYLQEPHHIVQLFERCMILPESEAPNETAGVDAPSVCGRPGDLRRMDVIEQRPDDCADVEDRWHAHGRPLVPHVERSDTVEVSRLGLLVLDLALPVTLDALHSSLDALKKAWHAQQQQRAPPPPETMQAVSAAAPSGDEPLRRSSRQRAKPQPLVGFAAFADWWVRILPRPSGRDQTQVIKIVQAARKQHALEVAAASQHRQAALHQHAMLRSVQGRSFKSPDSAHVSYPPGTGGLGTVTGGSSAGARPSSPVPDTSGRRSSSDASPGLDGRNPVSPVDAPEDYVPADQLTREAITQALVSTGKGQRPTTYSSSPRRRSNPVARPRSAPTRRTSDLGAMRAAVFGGGITASQAGGDGLPSGAPGMKRAKGSFATHKPDVETLRDVQRLQLGLRMQRELREKAATSSDARRMKKALRVISASRTMAANARAPSEQQQEKRKKFGERLLRKSRCLPENIVRIACGELAHHAAMQREGATLIEMTRKPHESEDTDADAHREQHRAMSTQRLLAQRRASAVNERVKGREDGRDPPRAPDEQVGESGARLRHQTRIGISRQSAKAPDLTQADGRPQLPESLGPQVITSLVERIRDATARAEASLGIVDLSTSAAAAAQERARIAKTNSARARVRSTTASPDLFGLHTPEQTLANREYQQRQRERADAAELECARLDRVRTSAATSVAAAVLSPDVRRKLTTPNELLNYVSRAKSDERAEEMGLPGELRIDGELKTTR